MIVVLLRVCCNWFSHDRLHESLGDVRPVEYERQHADREAITLAGATV